MGGCEGDATSYHVDDGTSVVKRVQLNRTHVPGDL